MKTKILSILLVLFRIGQAQSTFTPNVIWREVSAPPNNILGQPIERSQTGEDWWYAHKNLYDATGNLTGFVMVGYTSLVSTPTTFTNVQQIYNEGPNSPHNPITTATFNYTETCEDRKEAGIQRTDTRGQVGVADKNGKMIWCRPKSVGELKEVIQDPNSPNIVYVIGNHFGARQYTNSTTSTFLAYNYDGVNSNVFSISSMSVASNYSALATDGTISNNGKKTHIYVAKIDISTNGGSVIWERLYGSKDYTVNSNSPLESYLSIGDGYDIIMNSNGNLVIAGWTQDVTTGGQYPFVAEIDPSNGKLLSKHSISAVTNYSIQTNAGPTTTLYAFAARNHCIIQLPTGDYVIGGVAYVGAFDNRATITKLDNNFNPVNGYMIGGFDPNVMYPTDKSNVWEFIYHQGMNELLVPIVSNCQTCLFGAETNSGYGKIYRIDPNTLNYTLSTSNPLNLGSINAYDLRLGILETSDGGFITVSSSQNFAANTHTYPTTTELGPFASCSPTNVLFNCWDTDAKMNKFTSTGTLEWEKLFDVEDGYRAREAFPGDLKRQECMYRVTETPEGNYVISGNSSHNYDDYYMASVLGPCNGTQTYNVASTATNNVITISTNTTWATPKKVIGDLVIASGSTLTIANTTVNFADTKHTGIRTRVVVMPGAKLEVINSLLTSIDASICPYSMWEGINVVGTSNQDQGPAGNYNSAPYQGILTIANSTISNAREAIITASVNSTYNVEWATTGGVVSANNVEFINNVKDVTYLAYTSPTYPNYQQGQFYNCKFRTTSLLNNLSPVSGHVSLYDVRGVRFWGCEFSYEAGSAYASGQRGAGFSAVNAVAYLKDYVSGSGTVQTSFKNLDRGMEVYNFDPYKTVSIDHAAFTNTFVTYWDHPAEGILYYNVKNPSVTRCTFNNMYAGVTLENCQTYSIKSNTYNSCFIGNQATSSGAGVHEFYKNYYDGCANGVTALYENSGFISDNIIKELGYDDGLLMNCERFYNGSYDIEVMGENQPGKYAVVYKYQGDVAKTRTVKNWYTAACTNSNLSQWYMDGAYFKQYDHTGHTDQNTRPPLNTCAFPQLKLNNVNYAYVFATECNSTTVGNEFANCQNCSGKGDLNGEYTNAKFNFISMSGTLNDSIDGGNTTTLLAILTGAALNTEEKHALVMGYSPYLSDTVLRYYFNVVDQEKVEALHELNKPVSNSVWNIILNRGFEEMTVLNAQQASKLFNRKNVLQSQANAALRDLQASIQEKIRKFCFDTTATAFDSLAYTVNNNLVYMDNPALALLEAKVYMNHYDQALDLIDSLIEAEYQVPYLTNRRLALQIDTALNRTDALNTSPTLLAAIYESANDSTSSGYNLARAVRFQKNHTLIPFARKFPEGMTTGRKQQSGSVQSQPSISRFIEKRVLYPNPTNGRLYLGEEGNAVPLQVTVFEISGRLVRTFKPTALEVDLSDLENGIYMVQLTTTSNTVSTHKIIISR